MRRVLTALGAAVVVVSLVTAAAPAADTCSASSAYARTASGANVVVRVTCPMALHDQGPDGAIDLAFNRSVQAGPARLSGAGQLRCASSGGKIGCTGSVTDPGETATVYGTLNPTTCTNPAALTISLTVHTADGRELGPQSVPRPTGCAATPAVPPHKPTALRVTWVRLPGGPRVLPTVHFSIGAPTRVGVSIHRFGSRRPASGRIVACKRRGRCKVTLPSLDPGRFRWVAEARAAGYIVTKAFRVNR
ncbi:MAG: hypothetical protein ACJ76Z_11175 [Thermoleophilaceae bacterium]